MSFQPNIAPSSSGSSFGQSFANSVGSTADSVSNNLSSTFTEFSSQTTAATGATSEFLTSNTIIAKFAFILLILVAFLLLFNLGVTILGYLTDPSPDPYIIKGLIDGNTEKRIPQDPKQTNSIPIYRSNDQSKGMEFTWTIWLYINDLGTKAGKYQHIFSKGDGNVDGTTSLSTINNGPGLYIKPMENTLRIKMDTVSPTDTNTEIEIDNIPIRKWVHVAMRLQNTVLDVYVNGIVVNRLLLNNTPMQNYGDVYVCQQGGFAGKLSNLRYFSRALNVFEINNIVSAGPNLNAAEDAKQVGGFGYLSSMWYASKY
jgi:hypothetical protein